MTHVGEPTLGYDLNLLLGGGAASDLDAPFIVGSAASLGANAPLVGTSDERTATLRTLRSEAHAIARTLRAHGATRVLVACERMRTLVPALLGAWEASVIVELPPNVQPSTLASLRSDPAISMVFHDREGEPGFFVPSITTLPADDAPLRTVAPHESVVVLHTSGTTAAPKRFEKTAQGLLGEVVALAATFASLKGAFVCTVPTFHLYGLLFGVLLPLRLGRPIVDARPLFARDVAATLSEGVGVLVATPAHLRAFVGAPMPKSKVAISSGGRLEAPLHFELARSLGWTVYDVLGSTETGGIATRASPAEGWRPLASVKVTIEEDGRLLVESPWAGRVRTEDAAELTVGNTFRHLGRVDDVVKVAGRRTSRAAIETLVRKFHGIDDVLVHSEEDDGRGSRLMCAVTPSTLDVAALRAALLMELDPVLVPRPILAVSALPRDAMGKLKRDEVRTFFGLPPEEAEATGFDFVPTANPNVFTVRVPKRSLYFRGHFDVFPILPAVVQLSCIVGPLVRRAHPDLGRVTKLRRARFRRPLTPGMELTVTLNRTSDVRVSFEIAVLGEVAASGNLELQPVAQGEGAASREPA
jgi:acyl-coenzyme A synthetase/AMP-(fatty) acid ligase/3-hydroxymyristoyl/3-hydroxydecanoyl-(acyl carrier protein) dehydratase